MQIEFFNMSQEKNNQNFVGKPIQNPEESNTNPQSKPKFLKKKSFTEKWENHRFWLVRASYIVLRSVWMIVLAIGGFIAWLIALLFI